MSKDKTEGLIAMTLLKSVKVGGRVCRAGDPIYASATRAREYAERGYARIGHQSNEPEKKPANKKDKGAAGRANKSARPKSNK